MIPQVTVPVRLRLDATAAAEGSYRPRLRAALVRALARATATAPVGTAAAPSFRWSGPGTAGLPAGVRARVEREVSALIEELTAPAALPAAAAPVAGGTSADPAADRAADRPGALPRGFSLRPNSAYDLAEEGRPALWLTESMSVREAARRLYGRPDDWRLLVYWYNRDLWAAEHDLSRRPPEVADRPLPAGARLRVEPGLLPAPLRAGVLAAAALREAGELDHTGGVRLVVEGSGGSGGGPVPRGSTVRIGLRLPEDAYPVRAEWRLRPDPAYRALGGGLVDAVRTGPSGDLTGPRNTEPHRWDLPADTTGVHVVSCRLFRDGEFWQEVWTSLLVLDPGDLARIVLRSGAAAPPGLAALRAALQSAYDERMRVLAGPREKNGPGPYLAAEPQGPATPGSEVRYQLLWTDHPGEEVRLRWQVRALDPPPPGEVRSPLGRGEAAVSPGLLRPGIPTGRLAPGRAFNDFWQVRWADLPGRYEIGCELTWSQGSHRVVLEQRVAVEPGSRPGAAPESPRAARQRLTEDLALVDRTLARGEAVPLRAAWVAGEGEPTAVPLQLYVTTAPDAPAAGVHLRIWDLSPSGRRRYYEGGGDTPQEALDRALADLARVPYPKGAVLAETDGFTLAGQAFPARAVALRCSGDIPLASFLSSASTFLFVGGAVLSIAGAPYAGAPLIALSQVGGAAAAVVRLRDRALSGELHADQQTLLDALDLGGNLTGAVGRGAQVLRITRGAGALAFVARVDGALGTTQLVVADVDLALRLDAAVARGEQREVLGVLGEAAASGALLKLGASAEGAALDGGGAATGSPVVLRQATPDPRFVAALPAELRDGVEVLEGGGRTVRVHYEYDALGRARVRIAAGPDATPEDAAAHLATIREVRKYQGLSGGTAIVIEQVRALITGEFVPEPGTRAWDAREEIRKLTPMIAAERDPVRAAHLRRQLARHESVLAARSTGQGGVIAAEDRPGRKRGEGPVRLYSSEGQALAVARKQRVDQALGRSRAAGTEHFADADAARRALEAHAAARPPRPAALAERITQIGRLAPEDRFEALDALSAEGGRSAGEVTYLEWLGRSWRLRQAVDEAEGAARSAAAEQVNLRTVSEALADEVREKSRSLIDVMRKEGRNYRDRSRTSFDEVMGEKAWKRLVDREVEAKKPRPGLATDHLVALDRITKLDELVPLLRLYAEAAPAVQEELYRALQALGDHKDNLRRMGHSANSSKNNRSWHEITYDEAARFGYTTRQVDEIRVAEDKALAALLRRIEELRTHYTPLVRGDAAGR
ncbi:hypothetical protein ABT093_32595 [Kitasatospora sp. NPDC002551]|uniref:hypothetical protein n=1 Tax=Kitasatospora sp. NPDC002551 TaxID=3154539 RepID=UPI00332025BB